MHALDFVLHLQRLVRLRQRRGFVGTLLFQQLGQCFSLLAQARLQFRDARLNLLEGLLEPALLLVREAHRLMVLPQELGGEKLLGDRVGHA